jgi:hypothetical protein
MQGGATQEEEEAGDTLEEAGFQYAYSLQTWKADPDDPYTEARKILMEEVFHMVTVAGYARAHPAQFGMDDFTSSIACREMAAAECVSWHHEENTCPQLGVHAAPPLSGTCEEANCDCVEWFHQARRRRHLCPPPRPAVVGSLRGHVVRPCLKVSRPRGVRWRWCWRGRSRAGGARCCPPPRPPSRCVNKICTGLAQIARLDPTL